MVVLAAVNDDDDDDDDRASLPRTLDPRLPRLPLCFPSGPAAGPSRAAGQPDPFGPVRRPACQPFQPFVQGPGQRSIGRSAVIREVTLAAESRTTVTLGGSRRGVGCPRDGRRTAAGGR